LGSEPKLLAILFADVSGSTALYEKLGDRAALATVESVLRGRGNISCGHATTEPDAELGVFFCE
jgi:class 3 adenylate cyclase